MSTRNPVTTQKLVLAIDGSDHAMAAVGLVANLPLPETCQISILSVLIPRNAQYHATLATLLDQTRIRIQTTGRSVSTHLLTGYPAEQIIAFAQENKPDLLVLGAKGLRGTIPILLGGVAQQVVEYAPCPVLIVRAPHIEAKRVLLATDGSAHSQYAVSHLGQCPLPKDAEVRVMHVLPPEMTSDLLLRSWPYGIDVLPPVLSPEVEESLVARALEEEALGKALLDRTITDLAALNIDAEPVLRRGDTATEILNYIQEKAIDLVIVGSRGLSQLRSWLLGSVSSKLTHYAECSVMVVKMPPENPA